jgi:hypothetical protein
MRLESIVPFEYYISSNVYVEIEEVVRVIVETRKQGAYADTVAGLKILFEDCK